MCRACARVCARLCSLAKRNFTIIFISIKIWIPKRENRLPRCGAYVRVSSQPCSLEPSPFEWRSNTTSSLDFPPPSPRRLSARAPFLDIGAPIIKRLPLTAPRPLVPLSLLSLLRCNGRGEKGGAGFSRPDKVSSEINFNYASMEKAR
jgi:hypothetical protein